ncbi:hypothetical protein HPB47_017665, partial [Ixodes persulcatus]
LLLTGGEDAVAHCSDHYASMPPLDGMNGSALPLGSLQHNMYRGPRGARSVFHAGPSLQQAGTLSFLDGQVSAALALRSGHEFRFWTLTLVRRPAAERLTAGRPFAVFCCCANVEIAAGGGLEIRLKDLCSSLLGPVGATSLTWQPCILTVSSIRYGPLCGGTERGMRMGKRGARGSSAEGVGGTRHLDERGKQEGAIGVVPKRPVVGRVRCGFRGAAKTRWNSRSRALRVGSGHGLFAADLELDLLRSASALEEAANRRREIRASTYLDCSG